MTDPRQRSDKGLIAAQAPRIISDAVCTYCSCMCDDIELTVNCRQITHARNACKLGKAWFTKPRPETLPACRIRGKPASIEDGLSRAAELLSAAKYPLVYGLTGTTCEAQRVAVAIADSLGAVLDTATSLSHAPSIMAFQNVGKVTSTLGEICNRGDLVVFWGANPVDTHPRVTSKYTLDPRGMFLPRGRRDRTCVVIDIQPTATSQAADVFLQIRPESDFEAIWVLRSLARDIELDAEQVLEQTGVTLAAWKDLMRRMKQARYGVFLFGMGLMRTRGQHSNCEALFSLTRDLNDYTRFICRSVRARGNVTGADKVVSWRTGYPFAVDLARAYPRYSPGEYTASDTLSRNEPDAALILAADPLTTLTPAAAKRLQAIPYVAIGAEENATLEQAEVAFRTSTLGIHAPGTVYRMDEVPLSLRPAFASDYPCDVHILESLERRISTHAHDQQQTS